MNIKNAHIYLDRINKMSSCYFFNRSNQSIKTQDQQCPKPKHLGHEHQAPDHEATQPMMGY
jgi:hypothetical protein